MINWGIIGCGNVTEVKSGPAFNKIKGSSLQAVMRRDSQKAADYARRHHVAKWYDNAGALINDPLVNAIYIATPPSTHEQYALAAIEAGKPVYLEKPVSVNSVSARSIAEAAKKAKVPLSIAHYRRQMPMFKKVKSLLDNNYIGKILVIDLKLYQSAGNEGKQAGPMNWRLDPAISGGGYFHDLAPHQLDLLLYFFKAPVYIDGISLNQAGTYYADDAVACSMLFENGALMNGLWSFSVSPSDEKDICEITGTEGSIRFSVFEMTKIIINRNGNTEVLYFDSLEHVQQPMIEQVVNYFSGKGPNPCSGDDGYSVMWMIDEIAGKR